MARNAHAFRYGPAKSCTDERSRHRGHMRLVRAALLFAPLFATGCGYIHFGKMPAPIAGDAALAEAYTNLSTEHKILKQELALARKDGDALRVALERVGGRSEPTTVSSSDLVTRLNEATQELATLRASYARLQAEKSAAPPPANPALEEKLAASQRAYDDLQAETNRLRADLARARSDNAGLAEQLKTATTQAEQAQSAFAQLNQDLLAQKEARHRADQASAALRAQLDAVLARSGSNSPPASTPTTREPPGLPLTALQIAKAPPADSSPIAAQAPRADRPRMHTVQAGETLEQIAQRYYGTPERWRALYDANAALLGNGQPLQAGMELKVPEN